MTAAAEMYRQLLSDLKGRRQAGTLGPGVESDLVEALDTCWRKMSDEEQEAVEWEFGPRAQ